MAVSELINLSALLDDAKCFELVRQHRWPDGVRCPGCDSATVNRNGRDETQPHRQRYLCKACHGRFDDLTNAVRAGHPQPLRVWVMCLYLMGLNLSNRQIAAELDLGASDVQMMTEHLRSGLSSTFRSSFLSRSYQCPENGLGGDEAEGLVERQDGAAEWAGG